MKVFLGGKRRRSGQCEAAESRRGAGAVLGRTCAGDGV